GRHRPPARAPAHPHPLAGRLGRRRHVGVPRRLVHAAGGGARRRGVRDRADGVGAAAQLRRPAAGAGRRHSAAAGAAAGGRRARHRAGPARRPRGRRGRGPLTAGVREPRRDALRRAAAPGAGRAGRRGPVPRPALVRPVVARGAGGGAVV
ncbi:MAG: Cell division protein DivIC (FtsB), stabilizes FtsL against RasP cleavage, partial [uncultured Pseudonocardia sp.]